MDPHRVYLVPGLFGFAELAGYDYFVHIENALSDRFRRAGVPIALHIVPTPPTASVRRRAQVLAERIHATARSDRGPIHILGHSTGGLDARLLASPTALFTLPPSYLEWRGRLSSVVTMNTPHYGTPLAGFFATVSGMRLLYTLSLLTVTTLSLGGPPLTVFSTLAASLGRLDGSFGLDLKVLDRATDMMLRVLGEKNRHEIKEWMDGIRDDQGAVIQLTPESMDIFNAAAENASDVRYGCVATSSPPPAPFRFATSIRSPYSVLSATIYSTLYTITARPHERYPYGSPDESTRARLTEMVGLHVTDRDNDGVVPTLSMLWGELIWAGKMDHLDVVGHFLDDQKPRLHTDWLASGASCRRPRFHDAMNAIGDFLLGAG